MRATLARALRVFSGLTGSADHATPSTLPPSRATRRRSHGAARRPPHCSRPTTSAPPAPTPPPAPPAPPPWKTHQPRQQRRSSRPATRSSSQGGKSFSGALYVPSERRRHQHQAGHLQHLRLRPRDDQQRQQGRHRRRPDRRRRRQQPELRRRRHDQQQPPASTSTSTAPTSRLSGVHIRNVEVNGYGREGIAILDQRPRRRSHQQRQDRGRQLPRQPVRRPQDRPAIEAQRQQELDRSTTSRRTTTPAAATTSGVTGSGIYLADVDGGTIQHCVAYNNGKDGTAPVGIWAAGSNRVTIQYNESYNNNTRTDTRRRRVRLRLGRAQLGHAVQLLHGNDGPGYLLCRRHARQQRQQSSATTSARTTAARTAAAGIQLWGNVRNAKIYNNVVYISGTGNAQHRRLLRPRHRRRTARSPKNVEVRNNIFYTTGGVKVINLTGGVADARARSSSTATPTTPPAASRSSGAAAATPASPPGATPRARRSSTASPTGYQGDPKLTAAGKGGTIGNADNLKNLTAYKLQSTSPLINKGVDAAARSCRR